VPGATGGPAGRGRASPGRLTAAASWRPQEAALGMAPPVSPRQNAGAAKRVRGAGSHRPDFAMGFAGR
jgi:hypothetical protein